MRPAGVFEVDAQQAVGLQKERQGGLQKVSASRRDVDAVASVISEWRVCVLITRLR